MFFPTNNILDEKRIKQSMIYGSSYVLRFSVDEDRLLVHEPTFCNFDLIIPPEEVISDLVSFFIVQCFHTP